MPILTSRRLFYTAAAIGLLIISSLNASGMDDKSTGNQHGLRRASLRDRLQGLDSGLWKTVFGTRNEISDSSDQGGESTDADSTGEPSVSIVLPNSELTEQTTGLADLSTGQLPAVLKNDSNATDRLVNTAINGESDGGSSDEIPMNNLEIASTTQMQADPFANYGGPSLTTLLVAFVAVIVVAGALLSPKK